MKNWDIPASYVSLPEGISLKKGWMTIPLIRIRATLEPSKYTFGSIWDFLHDGK